MEIRGFPDSFTKSNNIVMKKAVLIQNPYTGENGQMGDKLEEINLSALARKHVIPGLRGEFINLIGTTNKEGRHSVLFVGVLVSISVVKSMEMLSKGFKIKDVDSFFSGIGGGQSGGSAGWIVSVLVKYHCRKFEINEYFMKYRNLESRLDEDGNYVGSALRPFI